jgi:predicted nucleotidyltransferase
MNIVEQNIKIVAELCKQYKVKNVYLFGSALTEEFSPESDIDFW